MLAQLASRAVVLVTSVLVIVYSAQRVEQLHHVHAEKNQVDL